MKRKSTDWQNITSSSYVQTSLPKDLELERVKNSWNSVKWAKYLNGHFSKDYANGK